MLPEGIGSKTSPAVDPLIDRALLAVFPNVGSDSRSNRRAVGCHSDKLGPNPGFSNKALPKMSPA